VSVIIETNGRSEFIDAYAVYEDNETLDIKELAEWTSDNSSVVVAYEGRLLAQGPGYATVNVSYQGISKEIEVEVERYIDLEAIVLGGQQTRSMMRTSDVERENIITKASAMFNVLWTPTSNVRGWKGRTTFNAGTTYKGIPYSQTAYQKDDIGFMNSFNNDSTFYANYTSNGIIMPKYGNDCSGYVSFAFGVSRDNTYGYIDKIRAGTYPKVGSYNAYSPTYNDLYNSYGSLQYGDAVVNNGHMFIIGYSFGESGTTYVCYEQTPPYVQYTVWDRADLANDGYMPFSKN